MLKNYAIDLNQFRDGMIVMKCLPKSPSPKDYYMIAESNADRDLWYHAIKSYIAGGEIKVDSTPTLAIDMVKPQSTRLDSESSLSSSDPSKPTLLLDVDSDGRPNSEKLKRIEIKKVNNVGVGQLQTVKKVMRRSTMIDPPISAIPSRNNNEKIVEDLPLNRRPSLNNIMKPVRRLSSGSIDFMNKHDEDIDNALKKISVGMGFIYGSTQWQTQTYTDDLDSIYKEFVESLKNQLEDTNRPLPEIPLSNNQVEDNEKNRRMSLSVQLMESLNNGQLFDALDTKKDDEPESIKYNAFSVLRYKPKGPRDISGQVSTHRNVPLGEIKQKERDDEIDQLRQLKERLISNEDPLTLYECTETSIGKGGMGEVFIGTKHGNSAVKVAIKKLPTFFKGKDRLATILNEINVMASSKHENIVNYIASYHVQDELWVCMEYMDKGSLYDLVRLNVKIEEKYLAYIVQSTVEALKFIHDMKRVHRDIKVDNVLLSSNGDVKLADFGAAVQLTFQRLKRSTMTGTPYYMSPEVINGQQYDEMVDIWSLGILCIELATHSPPFYDLAPELALEKIVREGVKGLPPKKFSSEFVDFVNNKCLVVDPQQRMNSTELLGHPWLKKACSKKDFEIWLAQVNGFESVGSVCKIL